MENKHRQRKQPQQKRSQETIFYIIKAATEYIYNYELKKISTNKIAEKAGVSIGTLYQYFSDKESIFKFIFEAQFKKNFKEILSVIEDDKLSVEETVDRLLLKVQEMFIRHSRWRNFLIKDLLRITQLDAQKIARLKVEELLFKRACVDFPNIPKDELRNIISIAIKSVLGTFILTLVESPEEIPSQELVKGLKIQILNNFRSSAKPELIL